MSDRSPSDRRQPGRQRRSLQVVAADGSRQRFLRGMITHDLVQRGVEFDAAYSLAQKIRDRLADREEVSKEELKGMIRRELTQLYDGEAPPDILQPLQRISSLTVIYQGRPQPFSHGLLARSIQAAGVDLNRAYVLVAELESALQSESVTELESGELARRVGNLLEASESADTALRYRMIRRIHRLPKPMILYIGGASGTGKSTLALELAPLLRIYRLNATDTIRQVMRMVFTPSILPALHSSSFEAATDETLVASADPDFESRLIATFEEQSRRVCVGVRAVVERAIAENMSIVVEGVHLHPSLVPFPDLEGSAYQVPLFLGTLNQESHRSRFITRSRAGTRLAERYLENFAAIRLIHDYVLQQAEQLDRPLLDTSEGEVPVVETLRVVTGFLEKRLPSLYDMRHSEPQRNVPVLMLVIDGLPDRPIRSLGGRTPLQAATTPTLDRLAREGQNGLADPIAPGVVADTAAGTLALLAQTPMALKRGPVEAMGARLVLYPDDVALRGNFATIDDTGHVVDRRAGRIRDGAQVLARALDRLPLPGSLSETLEVRVAASTEHRLAIVLRGRGLSAAIQGSDPGESGVPGPPLTPHPDDAENAAAAHTAQALAVFEQHSRRVLAPHPVNAARREAGLPPANAILTRGAGRIHRLLPLEDAGQPLRLTCISGDSTILGIARLMGGEVVSNSRMTANLDTNLQAKFEAAAQALTRSDLVMLHVKGADIAAHDRRPDLKVAFLEKLDRELGDLLDTIEQPIRITVASDHATLSESGQHAADPLPILVWGPGFEPDAVRSFDEQSASAGALQRFPLQTLLGRLFHLS